MVNAGFTQTEIGVELGITKQAVHQALRRAQRRGALPTVGAQAERRTKQLPALVQPAGIYETLAGVESQGLLKARELILAHIEDVVSELYRLLKEATPADEERVKMAQLWARVIFPTIKRTEHTGSGGAPLSILFKGINRGPQTVDDG